IEDRGLLAHVPAADRKRLLEAVALVYHPDAVARRRLVKETVRKRKAEKTERDEQKLSDTGIRKLRRQPVFTTPNVFPPSGFQQQDVENDPDFRESLAPKHCYICKERYQSIHHFYDQLCPACAAFNFAKRTELAD